MGSLYEFKENQVLKDVKEKKFWIPRMVLDSSTGANNKDIQYMKN